MVELTIWLLGARAWLAAILRDRTGDRREKDDERSALSIACRLCGRAPVGGAAVRPLGRRGCLGLCRPSRCIAG